MLNQAIINQTNSKLPPALVRNGSYKNCEQFDVQADFFILKQIILQKTNLNGMKFYK